MESAHGFGLGISYVEALRFAQDDSRSVRKNTVRRWVTAGTQNFDGEECR
jgi:hypothetical protein